jgi:hypothetical protein
MATGVAAARTKRKPTAATWPRATVPPTQQTPIPHLSLPEWPGIPFMSSGQQSSIDMSVEPPISTLICASPEDIGRPATAGAPIGSSAREAAIASARMVRKSHMNLAICLRSRGGCKPTPHPIRFDTIVRAGEESLTQVKHRWHQNEPDNIGSGRWPLIAGSCDSSQEPNSLLSHSVTYPRGVLSQESGGLVGTMRVDGRGFHVRMLAYPNLSVP